MATGNFLLGTLRNKLGDVVFYRSGGQQRSRPRVTPKNPKTAKQAVQRMVLATAAKMASAYDPIVNHSWEGIEVGSKSVQEFRRLAMNALRATAGVYFNDPEANNVAANFAIKGAPIVGDLEGLQLSRGRLSMNRYYTSASKVNVQTDGDLNGAMIRTQAEYVAELAKLGIEPGDQLTFVTMLWNPTQVVASMVDPADPSASPEVNCAESVRFCRVTFVSEIPEDFEGSFIDVGDIINPALIESYEGVLPTVTPVTVSGKKYAAFDFSAMLPVDNELAAAAVIRSQLSGGKWYYSTARMTGDTSWYQFNNASPVYMSYMDGLVDINIGDTLYLRNAVATPFQ